MRVLGLLKVLILGHHILSRENVGLTKLTVLSVLGLHLISLVLLVSSRALVVVLGRLWWLLLGLLGAQRVLLDEILLLNRPLFLVVWVHCLSNFKL